MTDAEWRVARYEAKLRRDTLLTELRAAEDDGDQERVEALRLEIAAEDRRARGAA